MPQAQHRARYGPYTYTAPKRPHKSVIVSRSLCVSHVPVATNGGAHKFTKNDNNWLHKQFEPQQVDVVVSSISILYGAPEGSCEIHNITAFPRNTNTAFPRNTNRPTAFPHNNGWDPLTPPPRIHPLMDGARSPHLPGFIL